MANIKKYNGSTWETTTARKYETKSEIIVPPTTIYADGSNITTYSIKGNTVQNGTPTPTNPIAVNGVGELVGSDYQIPISNGQQTTNIYLGSTQTTRRIKKKALTGSEDWQYNQGPDVENGYYFMDLGENTYVESTDCICSHFEYASISVSNTIDGFRISNKTTPYAMKALMIRCKDISMSSDPTTFKQWLYNQYANGTPVTVWYVLATATTAAVNEPLMKIGTYADTLSDAASIPTTEGANSITVDTTVQPSEFTATWTGWHDAEVKEKSENLFDVDGTIYRYGLGENNTVAYSPNAVMFCFNAKPNTNYACKVYDEHSTFLRLYRSDNPLTTPEESNTIVYTEMVEQESSVNPQVTINSGNSAYIWLQVSGTWYSTYGGSSIMFNEGSTALPYEPYWK